MVHWKPLYQNEALKWYLENICSFVEANMIALLLGDGSVRISTIVKQAVEIGECIRRYFGITVAHAQVRCFSSDP